MKHRNNARAKLQLSNLERYPMKSKTALFASLMLAGTSFPALAQNAPGTAETDAP